MLPLCDSRCCTNPEDLAVAEKMGGKNRKEHEDSTTNSQIIFSCPDAQVGRRFSSRCGLSEC